MSGDHRPLRPEWDCDTCGHEWPCPGAKKLIADLYQGGQEELSLHMVQLMAWAAEDLSPTAPTKLYKRFVRWTSEGPCRVCEKPGHDLIPGGPRRLVPCDGKVIEPVRWPKGMR
jgi:hypothetical protein